MIQSNSRKYLLIFFPKIDVYGLIIWFHLGDDDYSINSTSTVNESYALAGNASFEAIGKHSILQYIQIKY